MTRITIVHRIEYALLRVIAGFIRLLPLGLATGLSAACWRLIVPRTRRHRRALFNLSIAMPAKSEAEREAIARKMWGNLGRVMAETFVLDRILEDRTRLILEEPHIIDRYTGKLGPSIVASLHMGNWELGGWAFTLARGNPAGVYRVVENPLVDRYLQSKRIRVFTGGLIDRGPGTGHAAVARIVRHLADGHQIGMLTDLVDRKGIQVRFFGHTIWATTAPAWLARRMGARLWVARVLRIENSSRFRLSIKELKVEQTANMDADVQAMTQAMYNQFEAWIREAPEQWMWSNKRWPYDEKRNGVAATTTVVQHPATNDGGAGGALQG